ncbi:hypothetical protein Ssi03_21590 [Sphaerisporangium siamense]|nr:hypothetical protein Ssi03_21590 [Sphaerisporangium siamense]
MVGEGFPVQVWYRALGVSEWGYYAWRTHPPSAWALRRAWLTEIIRQVHTASRGVYGGRRVHAEHALGRGIAVRYDAVAVLTSRAGIKGLPGNHRRHSIRRCQQRPTCRPAISRSGLNQPWFTDITEHPTPQGKVHCCVVLDVYSRRYPAILAAMQSF